MIVPRKAEETSQLHKLCSPNVVRFINLVEHVERFETVLIGRY
jgi:hypothetical protein